MKKQIKVLLYVILAISLVASGWVGFERIQTERADKSIQIAIRYNDVLSLAKQTDVPVESVLREFKQLGATTLFVRENTVSGPNDDYYNFKAQGEVTIVDGYILKFYYPNVASLRPERTYVVTSNEDIAESIYSNYSLKNLEVETLVGTSEETNESVYFIDVTDVMSSLGSVGVGFNTADLNLAASLGYMIAPQIKSWEEPSEESLINLVEEVNAIDNVGTVYFADITIPGADTEVMAEFIRNHQLGFIEFTSNKQKGFETLAKHASESGTNYKVTRLHTLGDAQVKTFTITELMDRYQLALNERNNRTFLFKMPNTSNPEEDKAYLAEAITEFRTIAEQEGYTLGETTTDFNLPQIPIFVAILVGLASIVVFILLLSELGATKLGYILGALGTLGYLGLLKVSPFNAYRLMALFGAIVFPTYAMLMGLREEPRNIKETIIAFLKICVISYGGVLAIVGSLSRTGFALGINLFAGVKLAHIIPIAAIIVILVYKKHKFDYNFYKGILDRKISYGALLVIGIIGAALLIYTTRTGNSGSASTLELQFRQLLTNVLGVRPRTKEFLIGYPILICLLYYGYKEAYLPFVIFAAVGPISLVNTYAHIHTPLLISMTRSAYGIIFGLLIGLIAIWVIKYIGKVIRKWQLQSK